MATIDLWVITIVLVVFVLKTVEWSSRSDLTANALHAVRALVVTACSRAIHWLVDTTCRMVGPIFPASADFLRFPLGYRSAPSPRWRRRGDLYSLGNRRYKLWSSGLYRSNPCSLLALAIALSSVCRVRVSAHGLSQMYGSALVSSGQQQTPIDRDIMDGSATYLNASHMSRINSVLLTPIFSCELIVDTSTASYHFSHSVDALISSLSPSR